MSAETDALKAKLQAFAQEIQPTLSAMSVTQCRVVIEPARINVSAQGGTIAVKVNPPLPAQPA